MATAMASHLGHSISHNSNCNGYHRVFFSQCAVNQAIPVRSMRLTSISKTRSPTTCAASAGAGLDPARARPLLLPKLQRIVNVNGLKHFYPPAEVSSIVNRLVETVDFSELAQRWRMSVEQALDFAPLALYDIIIYADDSGSMAFEDDGQRIEDLKMILGRVASVATLFDDDGIQIRFMNSSVEGNGIRNVADANALVERIKFSGPTPLAHGMESKVLYPLVYTPASKRALQKPVLVITITDGEPTDRPKDAILRVIKDARTKLMKQYGPCAVAFQFAQVGRDKLAQAFLGALDTDKTVGDIIDCTSYFEMEQEECARRGVELSVEQWMLKLSVGAIDPSYDAEDE